MIKPELIGVLTIRDKENDLIAIVSTDMNSKNHIFYSVKKMGIDDIKSLLEKTNEEK